MKGHEEVRGAAQILRAASHVPGTFHGFIEGDDIARGIVDVVVTDGFTGNVALKSIEGTVKLYGHVLRHSFKSSWMAGLGYLMARPALNALRARLDPRRYNGAIFMGLNGICVKSHGGTDAFGFANAIGVAVDMVQNDAIAKMQQEFEQMMATLDASQSAASV